MFRTCRATDNDESASAWGPPALPLRRKPSFGHPPGANGQDLSCAAVRTEIRRGETPPCRRRSGWVG